MCNCLIADTLRTRVLSKMSKGTAIEQALSAYMFDCLAGFLKTINAIAKNLGSSLEEVFDMNIAKLEKRYPNGFESEKSINRQDGDL